MTALRLYELAQQFQQLEALSLADDIPPEVLADTLEGLEGDFDAKAIQVAKYILSLEANAAATKQAAELMKKRSDAVQRRADSVRAYLLFQCQSIDRRKIDCADFKISRRANPVAVQITEIEKLPADYWIQPDPPPMRIDKVKIKEALKAGTDVPGAFLESGESLRITL
jgi:uncharacterized protein (DUF3084 family)